jgi:fatty acid desaturase
MTTYLENHELRELQKTSAWKSLGTLLLDWIFILATIYVFVRVNHPALYIFGIVLMARHQKALLATVHEGAHGRTYPNKYWNNFFSHVFGAAPYFFSLNLYRKTHLIHHMHPLTENDPDLSLTGGYPIEQKSFYRKILRDLLGISYFKFVAHFLRARKKVAKARNRNFDFSHLETMSFRQEMLWILVMNALLFSYFYLLGRPLMYFVLWILPLVTVLQVIMRIRGVIEHAGYEPGENQLELTRTVVNPLETFFLAPHQLNYHSEHHIYPGIPFYNLPQVHKIFVERNIIPQNHVYKSYSHAWRELIKKRSI